MEYRAPCAPIRVPSDAAGVRCPGSEGDPPRVRSGIGLLRAAGRTAPAITRAAARAERRKASVRAKVEHPFLYVKRRFGDATVRYRGLAKNRERLALLGLGNLLRAEPQLAPLVA